MKQEIINTLNSLLPSIGGRANLSGTTWDITTYPQVEKTLSGATALTLSNTVAGKSSGILFVTGGGNTLTINGTSVTLSTTGVTAVSVFILLNGAVYISSDAAGVTAASGSYPLDSITAMGAWGLRKLRTGYSGNAVKVRRASDSTTLNVAFDTAGNLDVAALNTFINGTTGFVDTLYDQSGNGKDATQATTAAQPQILVNTMNGLPSLKFDGVDDVLNVATSTASFKPLHQAQGSFNAVVSPGFSSDPNALLSIAANNGISSSKTGFAFYFDDRTSVPRNNAFTSFTSAGSGSAALVVADTNQNVITPQTPTIVTALMDNANATLALRSEQYINQGAMLTQTNASLNAPTSNSATHDLQIGASGASTFFFAGYMGEIILIGSKLGTAAKSALLTNQSAYYNIL